MHKFTLALAICAAGTLTVSAAERSYVDRQIDSTIQSGKVVFLDGKPDKEEETHLTDSLRNVMSVFYYDQFRHFQDPGAPYFLFLSKDANLAMGLGGAVRMRGYFDWGGAIPSPGFAPYLIQMTPDPTKSRQLGTTPAGTCLYFRVIGRNKALGNYQLYIEANFNGYNSRDFHLKKAYAVINDFTIGYASSTFSDPAAVPSTVDAQGPNNKISPTSVLIRYMPVVKDRWVFAVSAEMPSTAVDVDGINTAAVSNWMPDWAAFAQYQWAEGQHVRLSGIVRTLSYRDLHTSKNHSVAGWGVQLSSVAHPFPQFTTYLTGSYGHGYAGLGGDLQIGKYDLVPNPNSIGSMYAPASMGWSVGVQYNFRPNLFATVMASQNRYMPAHKMGGAEYRFGTFMAANVFWNVTPRIQVGAEFDLGQRQNFDGQSRWARRIGAMCQFSF